MLPNACTPQLYSHEHHRGKEEGRPDHEDMYLNFMSLHLCHCPEHNYMFTANCNGGFWYKQIIMKSRGNHRSSSMWCRSECTVSTECGAVSEHSTQWPAALSSHVGSSLRGKLFSGGRQFNDMGNCWTIVLYIKTNIALYIISDASIRKGN